ncbi:GNAT family N-acetyltransferase [Desulfosporosinus sp. OT]|uniref:GNAT family N-acetyltransferase n=1 Tax=Desulfosporosinus sp. OT TaxID=913865 RepID=UPI0002E68DA9|nr:GNAT family N-acetyltransferase [Desulfosporosinus sp. OT]
MLTYSVGLNNIDWNQLFHRYDFGGLVAGYGKEKDYDKIRTAFEHSYKVVTAWNNDNLVGAARLLSDGICYGMIFNVGVLPEYQRLGIGRGLITELQKENQHLCIHLTSTFGNEEFYKKLGFRNIELLLPSIHTNQII